MPETELAIVENAIKVGKFVITPVGLDWRGAPNYEEWVHVGEMLRVMERAIQFAVGDWLNCGEGHFGDMAAQVIDHEHWSEETVRVYRWTASKVPLANRRADLSYAHHQLVAGQLPSEQKEWLAKAASGNGDAPWSTTELKSAMKVGGTETISLKYMLVIEFDSPADRDIVAGEHERHGRRTKKFESEKSLKVAEL